MQANNACQIDYYVWYKAYVCVLEEREVERHRESEREKLKDRHNHVDGITAHWIGTVFEANVIKTKLAMANHFKRDRFDDNVYVSELLLFCSN